MAIPGDKDELLSAIDTNFEKLRSTLNSVPVERVNDCTMDGHSKGMRMSVCNLVAYLIGWNELVLKWLRNDAAGISTDFPETGFKWNELGQLAQKFYRDYEGIPFPQLLKRLDAVKSQIVSYIKSKDNAALYGVGWYNKWTMGRMIQLNTSSPYDNARKRLRKWLKP